MNSVPTEHTFAQTERGCRYEYHSSNISSLIVRLLVVQVICLATASVVFAHVGNAPLSLFQGVRRSNTKT
jgi:hypothetical protein